MNNKEETTSEPTNKPTSKTTSETKPETTPTTMPETITETTTETTPKSTDKPLPTKDVSEPTPKPELACKTRFHPFQPWDVLIAGIVYIY